MDLDAVCARCALSPALSLVKYVETGRTAANTATNKPSKRKNELLGATWIADFLQKQNFDVDQPALCSSCLSVLEPEFGRWIHPRGGTKEKQLLCACGFWSCTNQKVAYCQPVLVVCSRSAAVGRTARRLAVGNARYLPHFLQNALLVASISLYKLTS